MTWISQGDGHGRAGATPQPVVVPTRHDGIGNALRSAFLPRASDMPRDLADLVDKLR